MINARYQLRSFAFCCFQANTDNKIMLLGTKTKFGEMLQTVEFGNFLYC